MNGEEPRQLTWRARLRRHPFSKRLLVWLTLVLALAELLFVLLPSEVAEGGTWPDSLEMSRIHSPLFLLMLGLGPWLLFTSRRLLAEKVPWSWIPLLLGLCSPCVCGMGWLSNASIARHDVCSIRDREGREYHLFTQAFLQGSELLLARKDSANLFYDHFTVLALTSWEVNDFLGVVRPEGGNEDQPSLYVTPDQKIIGTANDNVAMLVYDKKSGRVYGDSVCSTSIIGPCDSLKKLSPFMLLRADELPNEADFATLLDPKSEGLPDREVALQELRNPNPQIRDMAKRLLAIIPIPPPKGRPWHETFAIPKQPSGG